MYIIEWYDLKKAPCKGAMIDRIYTELGSSNEEWVIDFHSKDELRQFLRQHGAYLIITQQGRHIKLNYTREDLEKLSFERARDVCFWNDI